MVIHPQRKFLCHQKLWLTGNRQKRELFFRQIKKLFYFYIRFFFGKKNDYSNFYVKTRAVASVGSSSKAQTSSSVLDPKARLSSSSTTHKKLRLGSKARFCGKLGSGSSSTFLGSFQLYLSARLLCLWNTVTILKRWHITILPWQSIQFLLSSPNCFCSWPFC